MRNCYSDGGNGALLLLLQKCHKPGVREESYNCGGKIVMAMSGDVLLLLLQDGICEGSKRQTIMAQTFSAEREL